MPLSQAQTKVRKISGVILRVDLIGMGQVKEGDVARLAQSPAHGGLRADAAFDVAAQRARRAAE